MKYPTETKMLFNKLDPLIIIQDKSNLNILSKIWRTINIKLKEV